MFTHACTFAIDIFFSYSISREKIITCREIHVTVSLWTATLSLSLYNYCLIRIHYLQYEEKEDGCILNLQISTKMLGGFVFVDL